MSINNDKDSFHPDVEKMSESNDMVESSSDQIILEPPRSKDYGNKRSRDRLPLIKDGAVGSTESIDLKTTSKK